MCGIIVSDKDIQCLDCSKLKRRGPDKRTHVEVNGIHFVHYLLHMTGDLTVQPFINDDRSVVAIYNGEIYNYKELYPLARSDGECIIPMYNEYGPACIQKFDGEFAIVIFDFQKQLLIISSDVFRTKPLFYHVSPSGGIAVSSYLSTGNQISSTSEYTIIKPNTTLVYDLNTRSLKQTLEVHTFNLNQYKTTLDDWESAFENAVLKRYSDKMVPLVFLSSGLDSGAIACCLHKHNKQFLACSVQSNEDIYILNARKNLYGEKHDILDYYPHKPRCNNFLQTHCEHHMRIWEKLNPVDMVTDGCNGAKVFIMEHARGKIHNCKLAFSGIGADEIMNTHANYDKGNRGQVDFFPDNLQDVFPWRNFYEGTMRNYLLSDEYVSGSMGFETRYPFLDKYLVQEFLSLSPALKNQLSKYPLIHYLRKHNNPHTTQKLGFNTA